MFTLTSSCPEDPLEMSYYSLIRSVVYSSDAATFIDRVSSDAHSPNPIVNP